MQNAKLAEKAVEVEAVLTEAALRAGAEILHFWRKGAAAQAKSDGSPVTEADLAANAVIIEALTQNFPQIPIVSEELDKPRDAAGARTFFLVDPLDGTREFMRGLEEFTVNIALVRDGAPCCGVVYAPALGRIWLGAKEARSGKLEIGACDPCLVAWTPIACRAAAPGERIAAVSRSHLDAETQKYLDDNGITQLIASGSSIKFCLVAEGAADVYPRFGRTMEWDTAAADAVLRAAGGRVTNLQGEPLIYGKNAQNYANPGFIGWGKDFDENPIHQLTVLIRAV